MVNNTAPERDTSPSAARYPRRISLVAISSSVLGLSHSDEVITCIDGETRT